MNQQEYEAYLTSDELDSLVHVSQLKLTTGADEGTLAYGYTTDRYDWHAWLRHGELHVAVFAHAGFPLWHEHDEHQPSQLLVPNKRVYPDTVDLNFALLMRKLGNPLPLLGNFTFDTDDVRRRAAMGPFKGPIA